MDLPGPGDVLGARFRLEAMLGRGGFATVFRAYDMQMSQQVAVKLLRPERTGDSAASRARFEREARIVASLRNPHTIRLIDVGEDQSGLLFIAFELLPGDNLAERLQSEGTFPSAVVRRILDQLLSALEEAHAAGLLHRDIKPDNVQVFERNRDPYFTKLLDFGIARLEDSGGPSVTQTGELIGTPRYMSPEQLAGRPLSPATDIYSLGMTAFELLVGGDGLSGHHWGDQLERMRSGHVLSAPAMESIDRDLMTVIHRMTARDPADRIASAAGVRAALSAPPATPRVTRQAPRSPSPSRLWMALALLVGFIALGAIAAVKMWPADEVITAPAPLVDPAALLVREAAVGAPLDAASDTVDLGAPDAGSLPLLNPRPSAGCGAAPPFETTGKIEQSLTVLPFGYDPDFPHPLLVLFHDDFQTAAEFIKGSGFLEVADRERLILVALTGRSTPLRPRNWARPQRDMPRVSALLNSVAARLCVDESRVFTVGNGEGAAPAMLATCDVPVAASAINSYAYASSGPMAVSWLACATKSVRAPHISFYPMRSRNLPFEGGVNCSQNPKLSLAVMEGARSQLHGCTGDPIPIESTRTGLSCVTWACEHPYTSCRTDGGYGWPGLPSPIYGACDGVDPAEVDLAGATWEFFRQHQLP